MTVGQRQDSTRKRLFVISVCSGGGKSALLGELERRGQTIVEEPGLRGIAQERARHFGLQDAPYGLCSEHRLLSRKRV